MAIKEYFTRVRISKFVSGALLLTMFQAAAVIAPLTQEATAGMPNPGKNSFNTLTTSVDPSKYVDGAYIIDAGALSAGATKQTIAQGIKPYGLVYALVKAGIPVEWIIKPDKAAISQTLGNVAADFEYDCDGSGTTYSNKLYRSGAFLIKKDFALQAATLVSTWKAKGVVVDGPCTQTMPNLPVYATIQSWPRTALDAQNGAVAVAYFQNAEIPQGSLTDPLNPPAYRFVAPSALTPCDDMYVMPHADPTYATHSNLIQFVKNGGDFYASCHAVSIVENMTDGKSTNKVMNFLSTNGLVNYDSHSQGTPKYTIYETSTSSVPALTYTGTYKSNYGLTDTYTATTLSNDYTLQALSAGDPIAQFLGVTDAAQQQGSEQIFMPNQTSRWRPTTQIVVYDQTQSNSPQVNLNGSVATNASGTSLTTSVGPAASVAYGPAFGNSNYGQVMYVGGHSSNKGTVDDVATQRLFFNFQLLAAVSSSAVPSASDRTPTVTMGNLGTGKIDRGTSIKISGSATGGSGVFKYRWKSVCYSNTGRALSASESGVFGDSTTASTTFAPPSTELVANCNLTLTAIDSCGRFSFGFITVSIAPTTDIRITQTTPSSSSVDVPFENQVVVQNIGTQTGAKAVFKATKPANTTFDGISSVTGSGLTTSACSISGDVLTCDLGDVESATSISINYYLKPTASGNITSIVRVTTQSVETDESNNTDSDVSTVAAAAPAPSFTVLKSPATQYVKSGGDASFRIEVKNTSVGDFEIYGIQLEDTFNTGGTLTCQRGGKEVFLSGNERIDTLTVGGTWAAECKITNVSASGSNSLRVTSATPSSGILSFPSTLPYTSSTLVTLEAESLTFTKELKSSTVLPGQELTYVYTVTNTTATTKTGIKFFEDPLPYGLSYVPGSANVTSTGGSGAATQTSRTLLSEKFGRYSNTSDLTAVWAVATVGGNTDRIALNTSSSAYSVRFGDPSNSKALANGAKYSIARNITVNSTDADISVSYDCYVSGQSGAQNSGIPTVNVYLGSYKTNLGALCSTSRTTITLDAVDVANLTTGSAILLKFEVVCPSSGCTDWKLYLDDIAVNAGLISRESFNTLSSSAAYNSDSSRRICQSLSTSRGNQLGWGTSKVAGDSQTDCSSLGSNKSGSYKLSFNIPATQYASASLQFNYSNESFDSNDDFVKVGTERTCSTSLWGYSGSSFSQHGDVGKNSKNESSSVISLTPSGAIDIFFCFGGDRKVVVDDVTILGAMKGSKSTACTAVNPQTALDATCVSGEATPYSLAKDKTLTLQFKVLVDPNFNDPSAVGIVNLAYLTTAETGNKRIYAVTENRFDVNPIEITKHVDSSTVLSGEIPTFTYTLKNKGDIKLIGLTVTDDGCSSITKADGTSLPNFLLAFSSINLKCVPANSNAVLVQVDSGTVTAVADEDSADPILVASGETALTYRASAKLLITVVSPGIQLFSVTPSTSSISTGGTVAYTYVVKNTGTIGLSKIKVTASNCQNPSPVYYSGDSNGDSILDDHETWTYKCVTSPINTSLPSESATVSGYNVFNDAKITSDSKTVVVNVQSQATMTLTKQIKDGVGGTLGSSAIVGASNDMYSVITLVGTNGPISNIVISDEGCAFSNTPDVGTDTDGDSKLDDGETWVFTCHTGTVYLSETATAVAKGESPNTDKTPVSSNQVPTHVEVQIPGMLVTVEPRREYVLAGTSNSYTYTVKNTGGVNFTGFIGNDSHCATPITFGAIAMGESATATCSYVIPEDTETQFGGVATYGASSTYVPDTSTVLVFAVNPQFNVVKKATVYVGSSTTETRTALASTVTAQVGDRIVFTYYLKADTSTGASRIEGLNSIVKANFTDSDCTPGGLTRATEDNGGDLDNNGYIDPNETWVYTCVAKASLTSGGASLRANPAPKLAKIGNGGMSPLPKSFGLKSTSVLSGFANATSNLNSPVTFTAFSSLDNPDSTDPIVTLTSSSSVAINLEGVTSTPPPSNNGGGTVTTLPIITFNPNYSGPTPALQSGNGTVTLSPNTFKRPGFIFKGWSKDPAAPAQILDGGTLAVTGDVTLYAIWEEEAVVTPPAPPSKLVTINLNSNCSPRVIEKQTNAGSVKLNSNTFTCPGSAFAGWSTSPNGPVEYLDQAVYNFTAPATLYSVWIKGVVAPAITKGEYRFEVFFGMNSVVITSAEKKSIANQIAIIRKKSGSGASYKVMVEGWVQPNPKPGNIKYLSTYRAKNVAAYMRTLGFKATYKELYKGLGQDNLPKMRHASVIVTWTISK